MPKYRFAYDVGYRKPRPVGTMDFADDAAALAVFTALDMEGIAAELWRCDPKWMLAAKDHDGVVTTPPEAKP
jgi:hypothetical protein